MVALLIVYAANQATWLAWSYLAFGAVRAVLELVERARPPRGERSSAERAAVAALPRHARIWRGALDVVRMLAAQVLWPACDLELARELARVARVAKVGAGAPARVATDEVAVAAIRAAVIAMLFVPVIHASAAPRVLAIAFAVSAAVDLIARALGPRPATSAARTVGALALRALAIVLAFAAWAHADGAPVGPDLFATTAADVLVRSAATALAHAADPRQLLEVASALALYLALARCALAAARRYFFVDDCVSGQ